MSKVSPCMWFEREAGEAARLYVALLPDFRIDHIARNPMESPSGQAGSVTDGGILHRLGKVFWR